MKWIQAEIADGPRGASSMRKINLWYLFPDWEDGTNDRAKLGYVVDTGSRGKMRFLAYRCPAEFDETVPLPGSWRTEGEAKAELWAEIGRREAHLIANRPIPKYIGYMRQSGPSHTFEWDTFGSRKDARAALKEFANGPCVVAEMCHMDLYEIGSWDMIQSAKDVEDTGNPFDCMDVRYKVEVREDFSLKIVLDS